MAKVARGLSFFLVALLLLSLLDILNVNFECHSKGIMDVNPEYDPPAYQASGNNNHEKHSLHRLVHA
jgi:hypothetical protein